MRFHPAQEETGIVSICRKYGVGTGSFYNWKKKYDTHGEAGLKVTYDTKSKELKVAEEQNRVLRKLLCDKEVELEVQRELLKKVWDIRSKKDLVNNMHAKHKISKTKLINMVGRSIAVTIEDPKVAKGNRPSNLLTIRKKDQLPSTLL